MSFIWWKGALSRRALSLGQRYLTHAAMAQPDIQVRAAHRTTDLSSWHKETVMFFF